MLTGSSMPAFIMIPNCGCTVGIEMISMVLRFTHLVPGWNLTSFSLVNYEKTRSTLMDEPNMTLCKSCGAYTHSV